MFKYLFLGIIHPERVKYTRRKALFFLEHPDFGIKGETSIEFKDSKITVEFSSEIDFLSNPKCSLETLKNIIEENVRLIVDIYCYIKSYNYDIEITKIQCYDLKIDRTFDVQGEKNIDKSEEQTDKEFVKLLKLFNDKKTIKEIMFLKDVLGDFRKSIKYPAMTAFFCFRGIETIRKFYFEDESITDEKKRRNIGWNKLRNKLGFKRSFFEEIEEYALSNRHGEYPIITYERRELIMNKTRKLIDKFIDYIT